MRYSIAVLFTILSIPTSLAAGESRSSALVGRWYCEGPSGYGVTDRYSDGRFATKDYLPYDTRRSPEVIVTWGRWKLHRNMYSEIVDGATSQGWLQFPRKWYSHEVTAIGATRFAYISNDGHDTGEDRYRSQQPLLDVALRRPKQYHWKKVTDTVTPSRSVIPSWVNACPTQTHLTRQSSEPRPAPIFSFCVVSSSRLQPHALVGAVADLVSR